MPGHTSDVTSKIDDCINNLSSIAVINFEMKVLDIDSFIFTVIVKWFICSNEGVFDLAI